MGAGKTSVGRRVAELSESVFTDLDDLVTAARGQTVAEIFAGEGEAAFRAAEAASLPEALRLGGVVALGGGTPLHDPSWRLIKSAALSVFLEAPLDVLLRRIGDPAGRPLAQRGPDQLRLLLESRQARYRKADRVVDGARDIDTVAREVLELWSV